MVVEEDVPSACVHTERAEQLQNGRRKSDALAEKLAELEAH